MKTRRRIVASFVIVITLLGLLASGNASPIAAQGPGITERVSVAPNGTQGNLWSGGPSISADGRYVAFRSYASNLVSGDSNGRIDVFVHDRQTDQTIRVSVASDGTQGNEESYTPGISTNGRYITFGSRASNLVSNDTNGVSDAFIHDRLTGQTTRVSVASDGSQGNGASGADSYYLGDVSTSADGRYVAFSSQASNLVSDDTNNARDVFVHDRQTGETTRVSIASDGTQGDNISENSRISADGRYVAFESEASNLVNGDTNNVRDIFVHDRQTGETTRVSVASDGTQGNNVSYDPHISADGRYVAFTSGTSNLISGDTNEADDVFVHDRQTGQTTRISVASGGVESSGNSFASSISADGRYIAFVSAATNLVSGDSNFYLDVFAHDRQTGETTRASVASDGTQGNGESTTPSISADGRYVAFDSGASNLVSGDTNGAWDVFVHDREGGAWRIYLPLVMRNH